MIATAGNGSYRPGDTLLHQLDPRVKVVATLILVVLTFAATTWGQLVVIAGVLAVFSFILGTPAGSLWRMFWMMRWLLLFTLLLHLLFTPGRTLWGTSWLSYDGMLIGLFVCTQLSLAVLFASILALTTSVEDIVGAFGSMLSPLSVIGVNTAGWEKMTLLALNFIPVVYEQIEQSGSGNVSEEMPKQRFKGQRWFRWAQRVKLFVLSLVERGDRVAHELVAKDDNQIPSSRLTPLFPLALLDKLFMLLLATVAFGYWVAGRFV